ncbi:uncharacterized protein PAC_16088 [Phialocephala subalpina]|uniref:Uncharacterized protein n=1 Tax=Phialocephala subalpina TaxID=576137 RepID=A0A1L7XML4_9HELO|nr:uncharacterized protein PAC_16088 [Phialocephala subalpina]
MGLLASHSNSTLAVDEKAPPPSYTVSQNEAAPQIQQQTQLKPALPTNRTPSPQPQAPPQSTTIRFPPQFGIYHASGSMTDLVIAQSKDDPHPLYYISTHSGFSSQPSVILHSSPHPGSPPLANADFHSFSSTIDMSLFVAIPPGSNPQMAPMERSGAFSYVRQFRAPIPSTSSVEIFEWKRSSGPEVQALEGRSHGKKCARVSTGEVVAVFTHPDMSYSKKGKFAFMGSGVGLGEGFEVMAVMAILAIMEKERRAKNSSNGAAGGGGC